MTSWLILMIVWIVIVVYLIVMCIIYRISWKLKTYQEILADNILEDIKTRWPLSDKELSEIWNEI